MGREPIFCMIIPLGDRGFGPIDPGFGNIGGIGGVDPGFGNRPIHHPGHPDHGLPSQPGHPSHPINIPGLPPHISNELPPGEPVTINPPPPPPTGHENDLVIGVWNEGVWTWTAYDTDVSAGQPLTPEGGQPHPGHPLPPTPEPKGAQPRPGVRR